MTESRIHQRIKAGEIYSFRIDSQRHIPAFQFRGGDLVANITQINRALPANCHPVAIERWYSTPNPELVEEDSGKPLSPLQWLQEGRAPEQPARLADALSDHP